MAPGTISPASQPIANATDLSAQAIKEKLSHTGAFKSEAKLAELDASKLKITKTTTPRAVPALDDPIRNVSSYATDHMVTATWKIGSGWEAPELRPYGPLSLMPTASVLHYATECFEGMKAYRGFDGKLRLFRPSLNANRFLVSSSRISLPTFDPKELQKLVEVLMEVDGAKFLPKDQPGKFLYLRPTMIGTQAELGVQSPKEAMLFIIATYMPDLTNPTGMKLLASQNDTVRAWPGGFGFAKVGANYGPSLMANAEARAQGYDQILWLFGDDARVTEAGASNFFTVMRNKETNKIQIITAPLGDKIILDGVTRRSVLELARSRLTQASEGLEEVEVVERVYTMNEIVEASKEGRLIECFACGTAYFVVAVGKIHFRGLDIDVPMAQGNTGDYTAKLKNWLKGIMYGTEEHEWAVVINEREI